MALNLSPQLPPTGHVFGLSLKLNNCPSYQAIKAPVQDEGKPAKWPVGGTLGLGLRTTGLDDYALFI